MGRFLHYAWRIALNLFYLLVVGFVLVSIRDDGTRIIVAGIAILYAQSVLAQMQSVFRWRTDLLMTADRQVEIMTSLRGDYDDAAEARADAKRELERLAALRVVDMVGLGFIHIASLWAVFASI